MFFIIAFVEFYLKSNKPWLKMSMASSSFLNVKHVLGNFHIIIGGIYFARFFFISSPGMHYWIASYGLLNTFYFRNLCQKVNYYVQAHRTQSMLFKSDENCFVLFFFFSGNFLFSLLFQVSSLSMISSSSPFLSFPSPLPSSSPRISFCSLGNPKTQ